MWSRQLGMRPEPRHSLFPEAGKEGTGPRNQEETSAEHQEPLKGSGGGRGTENDTQCRSEPLARAHRGKSKEECQGARWAQLRTRRVWTVGRG